MNPLDWLRRLVRRDDMPPEVERLRGWTFRAAERELRRSHSRSEAKHLIWKYKARLGLTHGD